MKAIDLTGRETEVMANSIEHERWTNAILRALHELRCASVSGLDKHCCGDEPMGASHVSPRAASIPPPDPMMTH
ncbi:MAG: hypothetical protein HUU21_08425 [Polyangiaceae bacterium]|nr:hypothetical protein [Polyangiaceae bacterium]